MRALVASAALALCLTLAGGAGAQAPTLFGTVGPGFSIRLADASGNPAPNLDPGTYTFQIEDKSPEHNFHLTGPGVDKATEVDGTGTVMWTVTLVAGSFHYQCDPHSSTLRGNFTVGSAAPPPVTTPTAPKPVALRAAVGPGPTIVVTKGAARLRTVAHGPAVITVRDRSATDNLHLIGPGVNRATSKPGKPTLVWKVTLKRGLYVYRSDATPTLKGSFRVT